LKFVAHHLWEPARRVSDPRHGMPADIGESLRAEGLLRCAGPCLKHRQAAPGELEHTGPLERDRRIVRAPSLRSALHLAVRASSRPRERKSEPAVTRDVLDWLIATCATDRLADARDLAILLLTFASGGCRGSEVARLRIEQLRDELPRRLDPRDPQSPPLPCLAIQVGGPRRATPTRRAGRFWSALRSRRCSNGWSARTLRRGRSSGRSTAGRRWTRRRSRRS
jgi:integrase